MAARNLRECFFFGLAATTVSPTGAEHAAIGSCTWAATECWGTAATI